MRLFFSANAAFLLLLGLAGCSAAPAAQPAEDAASAAPSRSITVFAAASLTEVFTGLGEDFEAQNPGVRVAFNFAGSSDLVAQLTEGAPGDVFASADGATMDKAIEGGVIDGEPRTFATNSLEIVVPVGNPDGVRSLADLVEPGLSVVVCAPQVPCGAAAERVTEATGVALAPVSEESSVTDVLAKVTSGQADAGLVYVTDIARAGGSVEGVAFPESRTAVNSYPIARVAGSAGPDLAQAFLDFVTGDEGRAALAAAGFGAP